MQREHQDVDIVWPSTGHGMLGWQRHSHAEINFDSFLESRGRICGP
jgi:hypothetical protein